MIAVREQIFGAVEQLLATVPTVLEVERMPSGDPAKFNALHLFDEGDQLVDGEAGTSRWALNLGIDGYVQGGSGAEAHAALNQLAAGVVEVLFAEPVLGGLASEIELERMTVTVAERASARRLAFSMDLIIHYATRRGMPQIID